MGAMATDPVDFQTRMGTHWPHLRDLLTSIYVDRPDLDVHLAALQEICTRAHQTRSDALKELDQRLTQGSPLVCFRAGGRGHALCGPIRGRFKRSQRPNSLPSLAGNHLPSSDAPVSLSAESK